MDQENERDNAVSCKGKEDQTGTARKKSHFITGQPQNAKNANVNFHKRYKPEMVWTSDPTGFDPMVFDPVTPPDLNC